MRASLVAEVEGQLVGHILCGQPAGLVNSAITSPLQGAGTPGFILLAEGEPIDVPDGVEVGGGFGADQDAHGYGHTTRDNQSSNPSNNSSIERECILPKSMKFDRSRGNQPCGSRSIW